MRSRAARAGLLWILATVRLAADVGPNIVWITAEDLSPHLGSYGDIYADTLNLDRLAAEGVRYTSAFAHAGVCAPARSGLITGVYPSSLGSHHMRSRATLPDGFKTLPALLRDAGYYTGNVSKTDYNFEVPDGAWDGLGEQAHWRYRAEEQPFFYVINLFISHESRVRLSEKEFSEQTSHVKAEQRRSAAEIKPPPYHPDTPKVRADWARYYEMITEMDAQAGEVLAELAADGLVDDTIVFFFADHGTGLPRAKQFIFDSGLQVPLIVRFPEKLRHLAPAAAGQAIDRLVSFVDFAPSMLSLAGVKIPTVMQGRAFLGADAAVPRNYIYAIRDRMDERYDMNRAVRDRRFKYHRNPMPYLPHYPWLDYMDLLETSKEMRRLAAAGELEPGLAHFMAPTKPPEELYDIQADPHELRNLASDPSYADELATLREVFRRWTLDTVDAGYIPEQMLRDGAERAGSEYAFARSKAYPLERVLETTFLFDDGLAASDELVERLSDPNPVVRFWAAVGVTSASEDLDRHEPAREALERLLTDAQAEVRIAAAEALCALGRPARSLPILAGYLRDERWPVRVFAANVIDRIGEQARPLVSEMKAAHSAPLPAPRYAEVYVPWLLAHALRELDALD